MAVTYNRKDIALAIDPGFDATKICINGITLKIPNSTIDITGKSEEFLTLGDKKANNFICSHYITDKEYLVGDLARQSAMEKSAREKSMETLSAMDSYSRFGMQDFQVHFMTSIGLALIEYAKVTMQKNFKPIYEIVETDDPNRPGKKLYVIPSLSSARIIIGVALPNDVVMQVWPNITSFLINKHCFEIDTSDGRFKVEFEIQATHAMPASQVICALLGAASDDDGKVIDAGNNSVLNNLPAIVIDGGYKTVGLFELTTAHQVSSAESNTDYAMGNAHKEVARILNEKYGRTDITPIAIPNILETKKGIVYALIKDENGKEVETKIDVKSLVREAEEKLCKGLIEYLNKKFDNMLDVNEILITGGTGAAYYKNISKYMRDNRGHLADSIIITDYEFKGEKIEPVFAIAIGMYKTLMHELKKAYAKEEKKNLNEGTN